MEAKGEKKKKRRLWQRLFSGSWLAANLANLAVSANGFFFLLPPTHTLTSLPSPQEWNRTLPLISRRAASRPQRAAAVTGGRGCLFISLFLTLPKGTHPLKTVNGLWFRSVCAQLSYLIKYLQPLIGPSGSGPCGQTPQRSPRQVSNTACMRTNAPGVHAKLQKKKGKGE